MPKSAMAQDDDAASKTHEPTQHKLDQLREQGNVPTSKEVNNLFALGGILALIGLAAPWSMAQLGILVRASIAEVGTTELTDASAIGAVLSQVGLHALALLLPLLILLLVIGYLGGIVQNGFLYSTESITPKLEKISPLAGFKRLFSLRSLAELVKAILKFAVIGGAIAAVLWSMRGLMPTLPEADLAITLATSQRLMLYVVGTALAIMMVLAIADYLFQRMQWMNQHRMSHEEMKNEIKETMGDPHIKQRQRQIRMERMRRRMMQSVPQADVVITNPTHYSVALRYKPDEGDDAPVVLAKGLDNVAMRIREIAREHNIPFYEDPPLARALYASADIDQPIPLDLYEAVAKVISFIYQLKKKRAA